MVVFCHRQSHQKLVLRCRVKGVAPKNVQITKLGAIKPQMIAEDVMLVFDQNVLQTPKGKFSKYCRRLS